MPKYVIERDMPGAGALGPEALREASQRSCAVLARMGPGIQWIHSYVTDDRIYCVYLAENQESLRQHAQDAGFPANRISAVRQVIEPVTAE